MLQGTLLDCKDHVIAASKWFYIQLPVDTTHTRQQICCFTCVHDYDNLYQPVVPYNYFHITLRLQHRDQFFLQVSNDFLTPYKYAYVYLKLVV